jgi:UDP-glucose 4-epimerase
MPVLFSAPPLVTGASGFVGRALLRQLPDARRVSLAGDDWESACRAAASREAVVIHLAARVHAVPAATDAEYLHDNAEKTRLLAQCAADAGARAFVFLSTIKVNGEETSSRPFTALDPPHPEDGYARSKLAAEEALAEAAARSGLRVAIVRAPLVYGPGAKGNLAALLRLADTPWPLPFASLDRPRSFVHVDDLCTLLIACATNEAARGIHVAAHRQPASTALLVRSMRRELGRPERLYAMPAAALEAVATVTGQRDRMRRLTRALEVDPSATERELGWSARLDAGRCVREMVAAYRERGPA